MTEQERNIYQTALRRCREYAESRQKNAKVVNVIQPLN